MFFTPEQVKGRIKNIAKVNQADARVLMRIVIRQIKCGCLRQIICGYKRPVRERTSTFPAAILSSYLRKGAATQIV